MKNMTSFLVTGKNQQERDVHVQKLCSQFHIDPFDVTIIDLKTQDPKKKSEEKAENQNKSIGIEIIKNMQKQLFLKPLKSESKALVIHDCELLTIPAQNALLKTLEEPPEHTIIVLTADSKDALLPTILSRCQLIDLGFEQHEITEEEAEKLQQFLESLPDLTVGKSLKQAETLAKNKDDAIIWLEKMIVIVRNELLGLYRHSDIFEPELAEGEESHSYTHYYLAVLKSFQKTHTILKTTNANPRLALENLLLSLIPQLD